MAFDSIYTTAGSALQAQTIRLNTVASNMANADTLASSAEEAFRAIKPVFGARYRALEGSGGLAGADVQMLGLVQSDRTVERRHEPGNPLADAEGYVWYSNVNMVEEYVDMMSASRGFQTAVDVISRANSMQQSLLRLGQA
ncbi:MAG: flagellar basal body rod protein FlgC [Spongiibacteraceae bacterium]|jgi:flagellar basal-body rod protein FlgC|nr:flagellar basal body rod protein FlgC [Spongiibacteraceae bacterium]